VTRRAVTALAAAVALLAIPPGAAALPDGWAGAGFVQARGGTYLTDAFGRRLQLHGVNLVAKCGGGAIDLPYPGTPCVGPARGPRLAYVLSPTARDPGRRFTARDAGTLARLGFNVVRLGIVWEGLEPGPPAVGPDDATYCAPHAPGAPFPRLGPSDPYDPATVRRYLARTDRIVALLARAGIRVIVDMHSDVYGSAFAYPLAPHPWNAEGAPPWATCTDGDPLTMPTGWPGAFGVSAVRVAIHHFWANDVRADLQGQFARVLAAVARHYRDNADVLGYDLYNEPNDQLSPVRDAELQCDDGGPRHEPASCAAAGGSALPDGLIGAVQRADPTHVVFYEPNGDSDYGIPTSIGISEPMRFPRLAFAFHIYGYPPLQIPQTLDERGRMHTLPHRAPPPAVMDEFGATNRAARVAATVQLAEATDLSWAYWSAMQLHDPTRGSPYEGVLNQTTRRPYAALAQALAVPYAWATAGEPGLQSFDRVSRAFTYDFLSSPRIAAPTQIEVPAYTYPRGYTVRVAGARVVSRPNASVLALSCDGPARRVVVELRPR